MPVSTKEEMSELVESAPECRRGLFDYELCFCITLGAAIVIQKGCDVTVWSCAFQVFLFQCSPWKLYNSSRRSSPLLSEPFEACPREPFWYVFEDRYDVHQETDSESYRQAFHSMLHEFDVVVIFFELLAVSHPHDNTSHQAIK